MAKQEKKQRADKPEESEKKPFNFKLLALLALNTVLFFGIYELGNHFEFYPIFWIYFALTLGFTAAYFIYNRGFVREKVTPEMLPEDWSAEKKCEFFDDRDRRKKRSKWMLLIIIPLILTLVFDMVNLFYVDRLKELFKS